MAAGLLEAEIVTADRRIRVVNPCNDPDLFWALKGGGGGTFGVVTRLTLRTHELPRFFGRVDGNPAMIPHTRPGAPPGRGRWQGDQAQGGGGFIHGFDSVGCRRRCCSQPSGRGSSRR